VFVVIVGVLVAALHLYLWKRLVKDTVRPGRGRLAGTVVIVALGLLVVATIGLSRVVGPVEGEWFEAPGFVWLGLAAYLVLALLVLELARLAARSWVRKAPSEEVQLSRRLLLARGLAVTAGVASAGVVGTGMVSALGPPDVRRVDVPLRALHPDMAGFRIAVVSDIHLGPMLGRKHTERLVRMINETSPDLVAVVGDMADGTVAELGPAAEPLRDLVSRNGSFFVTGNHEYYSGYQEWVGEMDRLGVHPLRNERTTITHGAGGFTLAGVNDLTGRSMGDAPDFDRALGGRDPSVPTVLLAHQPVQVDEASRRGVDLQLSGHTHGGQAWPFHYVVGLGQPSLAGLSQVDKTWLYVTRGAGFWGPPVRIGAPPDITVVTLKPAT
jgi:predicted MPP superfamily phosphohydrolase